eukprot:13117517-Alexandrium_andersonii.AAC.1
MGKVVAVLGDHQKLASFGLDCSVQAATLKKLKTDHPMVREQDVVAQQVWTIALQIISKRCLSMTWHCEGYPGRVAMLLSDDSQVKLRFIDRFVRDYAAFRAALEFHPQSPALASLLKASPFQTTFVSELAALLVSPASGVSRDHLMAEATEAARHIFG